mgnify:CR=1 FL=1
MEEKAKKLGEIRSWFTFLSLGFIIVGLVLAVFFGKVTFFPFSYSSLPLLVTGSVLFGVGLLVLIVSQAILNTKLGKIREEKEKAQLETDNGKMNKYQKAKKIKEEYRNRK